MQTDANVPHKPADPTFNARILIVEDDQYVAETYIDTMKCVAEKHSIIASYEFISSVSEMHSEIEKILNGEKCDAVIFDGTILNQYVLGNIGCQKMSEAVAILKKEGADVYLVSTFFEDDIVREHPQIKGHYDFYIQKNSCSQEDLAARIFNAIAEKRKRQ